MAFCKYCGKQLADGEVCACPGAANEVNTAPQAAPEAAPQAAPEAAPQAPYQAAPQTPYQAAPQTPYQQAPQAPYQQAPQAGYQQAPGGYQPAPGAAPMGGGYYAPAAPKAPSAFGTAMKDVWNLFLNLFKKPASAASDFIKSGTRIHAFILIGIQAIAITLLMIVFACQFNDIYKDNPYFAYEINVFVVILVGLISVAALNLAFAGILMAFIKMFKGNITFDEALKATAVGGYIAVPFIVVGILFALLFTGDDKGIAYKGFFMNSGAAMVGLSWGLILSGIGYIFGMLMIMANLSDICNLDKDKQLYAFFLSVVAMILVYLLFADLITEPLLEAKEVQKVVNNYPNPYYGG
ncbi:MAG: YIP1 family protein [Clostridia bacterium]|nr:YIP1 family protein [Clostridia bacterium]